MNVSNIFIFAKYRKQNHRDSIFLGLCSFVGMLLVALIGGASSFKKPMGD